jgi:hypothetical protein
MMLERRDTALEEETTQLLGVSAVTFKPMRLVSTVFGSVPEGSRPEHGYKRS